VCDTQDTVMIHDLLISQSMQQIINSGKLM